jgi:alpha-mannosidase
LEDLKCDNDRFDLILHSNHFFEQCAMDISTAVLPALATTMMICPTSHNDWDWQQTFGGYYNCSSNDFGVHGILESVAAILQTNNADFRFSYAEVAFLRQFLNDEPAKTPIFQNTAKFSLLGGGMTSPDNQVAHSEVFIRNYLIGREYLDSVGPVDNIFPVAWVPDDFGHSPQLPVLVEALGMSAIGLSRIPGSPQPPLCPSKQLADANVRGNGTSFYWPGRDGSRVLTHFMPNTYYGISGAMIPGTHMSEWLISWRSAPQTPVACGLGARSSPLRAATGNIPLALSLEAERDSHTTGPA